MPGEPSRQRPYGSAFGSAPRYGTGVTGERSAGTETLYVFADETGDDRFDAQGSRYFGIAALMTTTPLATATAAHELLYRLQAEGVSRRSDRDEPISTLHATYDPPHVRLRALRMIDEACQNTHVHIAYIDKRKLNPAIRTKVRMYEKVAGSVAKYVAMRGRGRRYQRIVFAFDQVLNKKEAAAFKAAVKPELKRIGVPYTLLFHQLGHEPNGQISDYLAWAWSRKMERGDTSALDALPKLGRRMTSFDLFRNGTTYYYDADA